MIAYRNIPNRNMAQFNLELCFRVAFLLVLLPLASGACVDLDLGMGRATIPNSDITASTVQSANTLAKNGRLNFTSGSSWCAGTSDTLPYLQIDLQTLHIICAVATQGNSKADQWVKNYTLQLSTNGTTWTDYKEGGQVKFLRGNDGRNSEVKHVVYGVLTRFLRFLPKTNQGGVCMRTEVFGVRQKPTCEMEAIGLAIDGKIPNNSFTASSYFNDAYYKPSFGRLKGSKRGWGPKVRNKDGDYLQIDLLYEYVICAVATQGANGINEWTKNYKIELSLDGATFDSYQEDNNDRVFPGNSDQSGIIKNSLQEFASARFIRFQPTAYNSWKVLRVEVYGVLLTKVPSEPPSTFKLTASTSTSITASWQLPPVFYRHGRTIAGFKLFYKKRGSGGSAITLTISNGSTLSRTVTGLDMYTEYEFQVLAFTSDGDGAKGPVEVERTKEDVPSQAPSSFTVTAVTSTTIKASWQLPPLASRNGMITGFKLFFKEKASAGSVTTLLINRGSTLSRNVTGLKKYTEYEFQVLASTSVGNGPKSSSEVERTKEDVPSKAPSSFTVTAATSTTVRATWQLPTEDSRNGMIRGFKLFYQKSGSVGPATTLTFNNGTALGKDITGLDNNTEYEFQVLAFTSVGDGPKSSVEVARTMKDGGCVEFYLGMENGGVPDDRITATSELSANTPAKNGRLNYSSGSSWCARTSDTNPYLQIDLETFHIICAVSTQGNSQADQWVRSYTLQLSTDGTTWTDYKEGGLVKVFEGNDDRNSNVRQLVYGVLARYLRFLPQTYQGGVCMRAEVFGVKQKQTCNVEAIGLASGGAIPDSSFTATSFYDDRYKPFRGRLNANTRGWGPKQRDDPKDYLQIDLLYEHFICAIATQGSKGSNEWTTEYKIHFSLDGAKFFAYNETSVEKLFPGNLNRNGIVKNSLQEFISAKFIRFQPTKKRQWKVLRVEVYGILLTKVPSKPPTAFKLTASSPTSINASWQLPPVFARHGKIEGFKLFYRKRGSGDAAKTSVIKNGTKLSSDVSGLERHTEYEFQVLAFTSFGDGPNSSFEAERTMEDAPSQPPSHLIITVNSSTSVTASWQLPPEDSRHGIIKGVKLFYKKKHSGSAASLTIEYGNTSVRVTNLEKYTEYEFQVLAFTSAGDGPNSSTVYRTTMQDAPSAPMSLSFVDVPPSNLHGPRITLSWRKPAEPNGVIRAYTLFYSHGGVAPREISGIDKDALSHTIDVLGGVTYQFHIRAVTFKPGPNETITVTSKEYEPSRGPEEVCISSSAVNSSNVNVTWLGLPRVVAYGKIIRYEVSLAVLENCKESQSAYHSTINTTTTYVLVTGISLCAKYELSVRGYTAAGPGPYSGPVMVQTLAVVWSKQTPSSPSFSVNSKGGGVSAKVTLPRFPGNARFFQVIIITFSSNYTGAVKLPGRFTTQDMMTYEEAHKSFVPAAYVAFQFGGNDFDKNQEFVIGDGAQSSDRERSKRSSGDQLYYNKPLQLNRNYRVFLRAFVSQTVYVSSNFVDINTKGKPVVKDLPKRTILAIGELVVLNCKVSGHPEASVTWTKDGLSSIPRAQLKDNGKILVIKDVVPGDSGVYECKAMNTFGESYTNTTLIVAVPPSLLKEVSPSSVLCEKQTLCSLSCHATSYTPFNYSWTKDGQIPVGDNIKLMNNSIIVTPWDAQDYGEYVCHVTNGYGSTEYKITLFAPKDNQDGGGTQTILLASVIALSCLVVVLLIMNSVFIGQRRRAFPHERVQNQEKVDFDGVKSSPDQQSTDQCATDPGTYMELEPRPSNQQSQISTDREYQSLLKKPEDPEYYNVVFQEENGGKQNEEVYEEI